ncbi:Glutamate receptor 1 [Amphibalanus amphitrite]|uniref:Glutamate receptor 1 n=1 Tax=Amphibalanus amphitrite TaxID=1232801 RepID=A0A6A4V7S4_AMPAM|nr:Glutamate receptor 1 [Amphibalanus amphitrite]
MEERRGGLTLLGPGWSTGPGPEWSAGTPDRPLRVVAINDMPYISVEHRPDGSVTYSGYLFQLWQIMAEELGISYQMVTPLTNDYGSMSPNGTWTGVVGELVYGRADLGLNLLKFTPDRSAVIDYIDGLPMESWSPTFLVPRNTAGTPRLSPAMFAGLLRPLGADVWWTLAAALLALSLVLRLSLRFNSARAEDDRLVRDMGWGSCLFAVAMAVARQGWDRTPQSLAGRTATIFGWATGILIYINYTANLMSFLAMHTVSKPISSIREFVQQPDWTLAMYTGVDKLNEFRTSSDPDERELYRRSVTGDRFVALNSMEKGVLHAVQSQLMVFADFNTLHYFIGDEACNYVPLQDMHIRSIALHMVIPKGRKAFKKAINNMLLKLYQTGSVSRLMNTIWKPDKGMCTQQHRYAELSINELIPVFCLMPLGIVASMIALPMELFLHKLSQTRGHQI